MALNFEIDERSSFHCNVRRLTSVQEESPRQCQQLVDAPPRPLLLIPGSSHEHLYTEQRPSAQDESSPDEIRQRCPILDFGGLSSSLSPNQQNSSVSTSSASQEPRSSSTASSSFTIQDVIEETSSKIQRKPTTIADNPNFRDQLRSINNSAEWQNTVINPQDATSCVAPTTTSKSLLLLLHSLGCFTIREQILLRGLSPQKRWDVNGEMQEVTLSEAGINEQFVRLFSSRMELEQAIKSCVRDNMIIPYELEDGSLAYSLTNPRQVQISSSFGQMELFLQGLVFICHVYPTDETRHDS